MKIMNFFSLNGCRKSNNKYIVMSKSVINQNIKLLEVLHPSLDFLKEFKPQQLPEIANKAYFFVFGRGMILAKEQQLIDYVGIILEGKISISGHELKKGPGYIFGYYGFFNLLEKHAETITGDSEGIVLAFRLDQLTKFSQDIRNTLTNYCLKRSLNELKNDEVQEEWEEVTEKVASKYYSKDLRQFFQTQIDQKEKQILFNFFPWMKAKSKDLIVTKNTGSFLLIVLRGQLIAKGTQKQFIRSGQIYNTEGFLLNKGKSQKIYCFSDESIFLLIDRRQFTNKMKSQTFFKLCSFLLRNQINANKYQILTYEKKKQKMQANKKKQWSPFLKATYEILPLTLPPGKGTQLQENKKSKETKTKNEKLLGVFFKTQLDEKTKLKTSSSAGSKLERIISLRTEKNQEIEHQKEKELEDTKKEVENMQLKLKFYEDNFKGVKLDLIEYKSRYQMVPVLKQINSLSENKNKKTSMPDHSNKITLKQAFEEHMKVNRINEIVAKCAYKWLWMVRRKKKGYGIKNDKKQQ